MKKGRVLTGYDLTMHTVDGHVEHDKRIRKTLLKLRKHDNRWPFMVVKHLTSPAAIRMVPTGIFAEVGAG
jgi:hypothetical protein